MSDSPVSVERRDGVSIIHLDDGKVNAVSFDLAAGITAAIREAEANDDVGAVVIHGRPGKFSAGFDLAVVRGDDPDAARDLVATGGELVHSLYGSGVPIVAACTGHALAAGAMLLCGADLRIGPDDNSKIGMNEVAIGMSLPNWAITILVERLSRRHLQSSAATAAIFTPRQAIDVGFIDEVVAVDGDGDAVLDHAINQATTWAEQLDKRAYATTVKRLRRPMLDQLAADIADYRTKGTL